MQVHERLRLNYIKSIKTPPKKSIFTEKIIINYPTCSRNRLKSYEIQIQIQPQPTTIIQ